MKKLITILMIICSIGVKAQVYSGYDTSEHIGVKPKNDTVRYAIHILRTDTFNVYTFWRKGFAVREYRYTGWSEGLNYMTGWKPNVIYYLFNDKTKITDKIIQTIEL